ncbi:hypothetical protein BRADI_4g20671v3 [Brachypodium distachyon]|uniref:Uncharacterized protein n=2 Tax=Brachypodium distachyon TaxID=15368 RepID=A0A2K2CP09_BRADI|nr:hypothetical protein BRADI_4g20671v3 [Brachypodium distachyon]
MHSLLQIPTKMKELACACCRAQSPSLYSSIHPKIICINKQMQDYEGKEAGRDGRTNISIFARSEVRRCHHHHCGNCCGYCLRQPHSDPSLFPSLFIFQVICFLLVFRLFGFPRAANMELSAPSPSTRFAGEQV